MSYYNSRHSGTGALDRKRFADPDPRTQNIVSSGYRKKMLICYYCLTDFIKNLAQTVFSIVVWV